MVLLKVILMEKGSWKVKKKQTKKKQQKKTKKKRQNYTNKSYGSCTLQVV